MKRLFALVVAIGLLTIVGNSHAQSIKLVRTDVDSARSNFVTATYMFGVDVVLENVNDCNGVEFELAFNNTEYIHYSDWQVGGFGENATTVVIPDVDETSGQGRVYVLVISGEPISEAHIDDTTVIHLDFVVSQKSPHDRQVTFSFVNAHATVNTGTMGEILDLQAIPFIYDIHGFVNVWPGDTDNNGIVDEVDMDMIALHLFHGAPTKNMRSFKRLNSSTLWTAQRVLAWDSAAVTYADCDGDGNITPFDMLVIPLNFAEKHGVVKGTNPKLQTGFTKYRFERPSESVSIPLYIYYDESYLASTLKFNWKGHNINILGFEKAELFDGGNSFLYANVDEVNKEANLIIGDFDKANSVKKSGSLINIIIDRNSYFSNDDVKAALNEIYAVTESRTIIPLKYELLSPLDVEESIPEVSELDARYNDNYIYIGMSKIEGSITVKLFNMSGAEIFNDKTENASFSINTDNFTSGAYMLTVSSSSETYRKTILIVR